MSLHPLSLKEFYQHITSLESEGLVEKELEYVIYAKIVNPEELKKATSVEHQEQWEIRGDRKDGQAYFGSVRVRKSWRENVRGVVDYMLTLKTFQREGDGKDEVELLVTKDIFEHLKRLATNGMTKTRYTFPATGPDGQKLTWEVDVYKDAEGNMVDWCKLDLEVPAKLESLPAYPIELSEVMDVQPEDRTPEQKAMVDGLMDKYFVRQNAYSKAT